jgi:peptidyl-prolyl cis-trans isomerase C
MRLARRLLPAGVLLVAACRPQGSPDPVILELDGDTVRRSDFERHLSDIETRGEITSVAPEVRRALLDRYLEEQALVLEARHRGFAPVTSSPEDQKRGVARLLEEHLAGLTVTDDEVAAWYERHHEDLRQPETVTLRQILVATENEARDVQRRLARDPKSFENLAQSASKGPEASAGGLMGSFERGQLPAELEGAAFQLEPGRLSEVIASSLGYHVLRVESRQAPREPTLPESAERIRILLRSEKADRAAREFVAALLTRAKVNHAAALPPPPS